MGMTWWRMALATAGLGAGMMTLAPASAQQGPAPAPAGRTVSVIAEGEASAEPDIAYLNAGVQADGATAREALSKAGDQMAAVLAALTREGVGREDIQTSGLNVFTLTGPFDKPTAGPPPVIGYRASNNVTVTVRDLTAVDRLVDALVEAGATNLGGLQFGIRDTTALRQRALAEAVRQARPLAEAAATAAGLAVGEVMEITELSDLGGFAPAPKTGAQRGGGPVETGTLSLRVRVQVTFQAV